MRDEFESMEDYWQNKLNEERMFYEEQLKTNDRQFKELEDRLKEYEIMNDIEASKENEQLSTIDEKSSLEYQVIVIHHHFSFFMFIQIQQWEEEISLLKSRIELKEKENEKEVSMLKEKWDQKESKLDATIQELQRRNKELKLQFISINGREINPENMFRNSFRTHAASPEGLSSFTPHTPLDTFSNLTHGPASLPLDLVNNARKEVRRLQELRRYIQEECDHLLLKKERLKEQVIS